MDRLSVFEAKARFSQVVSQAEGGKQTIITKRGKAVARVVPEKANRSERWDRSLCSLHRERLCLLRFRGAYWIYAGRS